ncbi:MAG: hypothetical protein FWG65_10160 [Turicibacter sp.]|nr:hypothetical protein [Turicibacter sp.]
MEKVWTQEIKMQHPGKWIVMTDTDWAYDGRNRKIGFVYGVYETWETAMEVRDGLSQTHEKVSIIEGYDETPHIGGLFA